MYDIVCLLSYVCDVCNYVLLVQLKKWRIYDYFRIRVFRLRTLQQPTYCLSSVWFSKTYIKQGHDAAPMGDDQFHPLLFSSFVSSHIFAIFSSLAKKCKLHVCILFLHCKLHWLERGFHPTRFYLTTSSSSLSFANLERPVAPSPLTKSFFLRFDQIKMIT